MLKKTLWLLLSFLLIIWGQVSAKNADLLQTNAPSYTRTEIERPFGLDGVDEDSVVWDDDFESGQGGWTFVDVTNVGNKWHIDDYNAYAGNSWWCADTVIMGYDNHWLQYMISPRLDFRYVTNPILTFKLYYAVESPGGAPTPYDGWDGCNVWLSVDNGATWNPIEPTIPAYTCQSLSSFGDEWGMGPDIPGWADMSGGWLDAEFDLTSAIGNAGVKIRFALCSDGAYCTLDDPDLLGYFVDDVSIDDGATNLLFNDADGIPYPSEFVFDQGPTAGTYWTLTESSSHSATHSMQCDHAEHYNLMDALVSPWLDVPADTTSAFRFWLWCDLPDYDGDNNGYLEDYYFVEVSTDGVIWEEVFYDYGAESRPGGTGWALYEPGMPFNGNTEMDLTAYAGQQIQLRWKVRTDGNDDGGIGTGLYIDDVELLITGLPDYDAAAKKNHVPMPTSAYFDTIFCSVEAHNVGLFDLTGVQTWRRIAGAPFPLLPNVNIPAGGMVEKEWYWTNPVPGLYMVDAYVVAPGDEVAENDTSWAGMVEITADDIFEFGYDNRQYSYAADPLYYFTFDMGSGPIVRYTPEEDGVDFDLYGQQLKALFFTAGTLTIHIYGEGTATEPGPELDSFTADVNTLYPSWQYFDVSEVSGLQGGFDDFWIWFEITDAAGDPKITGGEEIHGDGHFFFENGMDAVVDTDHEWMIRAICTNLSAGVFSTTGVDQPNTFALQQNTPNPFNPQTSISFTLDKAGIARISVFDLMGREVQVLTEKEYKPGKHSITFDASNLASGMYFYRLEADGRTLQKKMLLLK